MSTRFTIYALATTATFAFAALAPTGASANQPIVKPITGIPIKKQPIMGIPVKSPISGPIMGIVIHPPHHDHDHDDDDDHHMYWWHHRHHFPWLIEQGESVSTSTSVATARPSTPVTTVPSAPCNCLTKTYSENGGVLFKDLCTNEAAFATPDEMKAQKQGAAQ